MRPILLLFSLLALAPLAAFSQASHIHGYVTDSVSGETLAGASVVIINSPSGTNSNAYGFYTLPVRAGQQVEVQVSALGYAPARQLIDPGRQNWDFQLRPAPVELRETTVSGSGPGSHNDHNQLYIDPLKIRELPRLLGEADPLKYLQTLPGVKQGREGSTGLHVRGGTPDQNLMLLDGVPIYNANHLFGYFSVFNVDAIKHIQLYKSGIPARYEGRLSSVVDIALKEGNLKTPRRHFSVSPIAGSLLLEGPIREDKSAYLITARRTWLDGLYRLMTLGTETNRGLGFHDLTAKYHNKINARNTLYLSGYGSRDRFFDRYNQGRGESSTYSFNWGNYTGLLRWNSQLKQNAFLNTALYYSQYNFRQRDENRFQGVSQSREVNSSIREWNLSSTLDYYPHYRHEIKAGVQLSYKAFKPEIFQVMNGTASALASNDLVNHTLNPSLFVEDIIRLSPRTVLELGLRNSVYHQGGETAVFLQPRAKLNYALADGLQVQAAYDRLAQHVHLLTNTTLGQPTDLWLPATTRAPTERSAQYNLSVQKTLPGYEFSLIGYHKDIRNVIEYQEGASIAYGIDQGWEEKITVGNGSSRGIESLLVKRAGRLTGHVGYTLSKTTRVFPDINNGNPFPFKYDRRHEGTILAVYTLSRQSKLSALFTYHTGNAITLPVGRVEGLLPPHWEYLNSEAVMAKMRHRDLIVERNNVRMPAYHRADLSYSHAKVKKGDRIRTWDVSVYNVYNRLNPYFIFQSGGRLRQYAFFPILPSVSYSLAF